MFSRDDETAALLREATRWADEKNWPQALACLEQAHERMQTSPVSYPIETWLKRPLYLQKARQFDKALAVCQQLIEDTPRRIAHGAPQAKPKQQKALQHSDLGVIFSKMSLICKREKQREQAEEYARQEAYHAEQHEKLFSLR